MRARAHSRPGAVCVVRGPGDGGVCVGCVGSGGEVAVWVEGVRGFEVRFVVVGGVGVHVEGCVCGEDDGGGGVGGRPGDGFD